MIVTLKYLGESKVLQYFDSTRINSAAPDVFCLGMKVMNHTGQWDAELDLYPPSVAEFASMAWSKTLEFTVFQLS